MSKKNNNTTCEESGVIIYLKGDGTVTKVEQAKEISLSDGEVYAIVEEKNESGTALKLYDNTDTHFDVKEAYVEAFEYDCQRSDSCFLKEVENLKKALKYFYMTGLTRDEKLQLKKLIYCIYKMNTNRVCVN